MKKKFFAASLLAGALFLIGTVSAHAYPIWGTDASGELINAGRTSNGGV